MMERIGQCHCGSLRVIATGEPDRVYLCHCKACQRRTGTAFHFGATYPKQQVRLDGERNIYERDADSGYRIRFHFCPNCGSTLYWEGDRNLLSCHLAENTRRIPILVEYQANPRCLDRVAHRA